MPRFTIFLLLLSLFGFTSSFARSVIASKPRAIESFVPKSDLQNAGSCSYTVIIKTSCSSVSYTRDKISIAFGDSYGNEVYVKRLDDPYSKTFERCSTDTYRITGPCMREVCYLHFLRQGSDGWKPDNVKIYGSSIRSVTFYFNVFLPDAVWYGFDECHHSRNGNVKSTTESVAGGSSAAF
ncbi:PREDICTED: uncharacterized protein LOC104815278 [Tarenaya hassleriana]|uniref:uncharacterized protein LOC104815278 n=1 Tax=Tarenaya hassleriana TaxID=28532 RepID=UPI00053C3317|nr:PREDICTED: uncharacterized protein LOC104815278 [Tarenaya hassleriana]